VVELIYLFFLNRVLSWRNQARLLISFSGFRKVTYFLHPPTLSFSFPLQVINLAGDEVAEKYGTALSQVQIDIFKKVGRASVLSILLELLSSPLPYVGIEARAPLRIIPSVKLTPFALSAPSFRLHLKAVHQIGESADGRTNFDKFKGSVLPCM